MEERRKHERHELPCPGRLNADGPSDPIEFVATDLSDGGVRLPVPAGEAPACGTRVRVDFSIPRSTPSTFMFEETSSRAVVVRHEPASRADVRAVALRFDPEMDLGLEV